MTRISSSRMDMEGGRIDNALLKNYAETLVGGTGGVNTGASYTIDLSLGNAFYLVLNAATVTLSISNPFASGNETSFTLLLKQDATGGRLVSWPASVKWPGGRTPVISTAPNKVNVMTFTTPDAGTTWFGMPTGAEFTPGVGFPLFGMGFNSTGELGDGTAVQRSSPVQVGNTSNWTTKLAAGTVFSLAIDRNGALWGWGISSSGQLGVNSSLSRSSPTQVGTLVNWSAVRSNLNITHAIDTSGQLWGWGNNSGGAIGDGTITNRSSPVQIGSATNWTTLGTNAGGSATSFGINSAGQLFGWGSGSSGQIGDTTIISRSSPVQVGTLTNWLTVAPGVKHTIALKTDSTLWGWGVQATGAVGDGTTASYSSPVQIGTLTNWSKIAATSYSSHSIKTDGTLWSWGNNTAGMVGDNSLITRSSPVQVGTLTTWSFVTGGQSHVVAIKTDGTLWGWGLGSSGQLGLAVPVNLSSPVQIGTPNTWSVIAMGFSHTVVIDSGGALWATGFNGFGQLGTNDTALYSSPVQIGTGTNWSDVAAGQDFTVAVKTDGTLWGWGNAGRMGDNANIARSSPTQIGTFTNWVQVAAGQYHTLAVRSDNTLWAWGVNSSSQLGDGTSTIRSSPVQIGAALTWATSAGSFGGSASASFGITTSGQLWSWGSASNGQLGVNDGVTTRISPIQVGTLTNWSKVSGSSAFTFAHAIKTDGTLWGWGTDALGRLGDSSPTTRSSPVQIGADTNWAVVADGRDSAAATRTDGTLWTWGYNNVGQGADMSVVTKSSPVQVGTLTNWPTTFGKLVVNGSRAAAIKTDNTWWGWGYRGPGAMGDGFAGFAMSPVQIGTLTSWTSAAGGTLDTIASQQE